MNRCTGAILAALLLLLGAGGFPAHAVTLSGRSSTQALWFADEFGTDHFDLSQYVRFQARQLDNADTISINGYGRAWMDTEGGGVDGRLYYLYIDKKELVKKTDVRLGRQFFFVSAGSAIVDGARVDTRPFGPLAITLVGGRHVLFNTTGEATRSGDSAAAVQVSLAGIPGFSADLSYFATHDGDELAREIVGLSASRRFSKYGELYTQLRYDLLSKVWSEIQVGARTAIVPKLTLNAEFFRTIPVFDATSIFSVFAVERFQELMFRAQYDVSPKFSLNGEYRNENFGGDDTANVGELGVRYRPKDGVSLYGAGIWREGTGGNLLGFELSGDMVVLKKFILSAGVQHDNFRRELMTSYDSATRFWIGGEAKLMKNVSATARIEDTISQQYNKDVRARMALNVDF